MNNVIVVCPCCASPVDTQDTEGCEVDHECGACGQTWVMEVDAERHAQYSLT